MAQKQEGLRLAFMGTPDYALPSLECLKHSSHQLLKIWTKPPSRTGRGKKLKKSAVALWAEENNTPYRECQNLKDDAEWEVFESLNLDAVLVVSFGVILPKRFLTLPRLGCLNLHPSLLPRWRGAAPIERALWAGDEKTGITIMLLGEGIDDGDILAQQEIEIGAMNAADLRQGTSTQGARLLLQTLEAYADGKLTARAQDSSRATFAEKLSAADEGLDWAHPAKKLLCHVRALSPKPGAWFIYRGQKIRLLDAELVEAKGAAGEILDDRQGVIACGDKALKPLALQREGKKALSAHDFLLGFKFHKGDRLES